MPYKGLFITVEGIDGSGKSTLIKKLEQALQDTKKKVLLTKEPGGSSLGKYLRDILQQHPEKLDGKAEFLLFAADRAQHFSTVVIPALEQGNVVITDRCADSSLTYQGYGRHVDKNMIQQVNEWAMRQTQPDVIFYLETSIETASKRIAQTRKNLTSYEQEDIQFWQRVTKGYKDLYTNREDVCTIDADKSIDEVFTQAWNFLSEYI